MQEVSDNNSEWGGDRFFLNFRDKVWLQNPCLILWQQNTAFHSWTIKSTDITWTLLRNGQSWCYFSNIMVKLNSNYIHWFKSRLTLDILPIIRGRWVFISTQMLMLLGSHILQNPLTLTKSKFVLFKNCTVFRNNFSNNFTISTRDRSALIPQWSVYYVWEHVQNESDNIYFYYHKWHRSSI